MSRGWDMPVEVYESGQEEWERQMKEAEAHRTSNLVSMARAAQHDERLSDGPLYGKLADEIERLTACFDAAKHEWEIAAAERDRLTARVAELEANEIQDRKDMIRVNMERDRLRAALEHYNVPRAGGNCDCGKCDPGRVAREALAISKWQDGGR